MDTLKPLALALAVIALSAMSGCATLVNGKNQDMLVKTTDNKGTQIAGAACALTSKAGAWSVRTPGIVNVRRDYGALTIKCRKVGDSFADVTVGSSAHVLLGLGGGWIGMAVDAGTGAMYGYPALITVPTSEPSEASFAAAVVAPN